MRTGFHIKNKGSVITPTLCSQCFLGFDLWSVLSDPRPAVEVGGPAWAPRPRRLLLTLCNGRQFAFLLWAELQHGVDDGQQSLPLAAGSQEDELQEDVLQVLQVGHTLLPLLVSLKTANFTLQQVTYNKHGGVLLSTEYEALNASTTATFKPGLQQFLCEIA